MHLGYTPYGPYDACFGQMSVPQLLEREAESGRTGQIEGVLTAMRPQLRRADATPVLLTGDFNASSHLDWTRRTHVAATAACRGRRRCSRSRRG